MTTQGRPRCIYCGRRVAYTALPVYSPRACTLHRDLLSLDPLYSHARALDRRLVKPSVPEHRGDSAGHRPVVSLGAEPLAVAAHRLMRDT